METNGVKWEKSQEYLVIQVQLVLKVSKEKNQGIQGIQGIQGVTGPQGESFQVVTFGEFV